MSALRYRLAQAEEEIERERLRSLGHCDCEIDEIVEQMSFEFEEEE